MLKHLLEPLSRCILVDELCRILCEETQVVWSQERHHDRLFVDDTLLLVLLLGVCHDLRLVAVETIL